MSILKLKRLLGIQFQYKLELQNYFRSCLADTLVESYNVGSNTSAARLALFDKFVECGPAMGFSAKQFAYGLLELIVDALINTPSVPTDPYVNRLNAQLVNVTRYTGIAGEEDFHFMVAAYNLGVTISEVLSTVSAAGPLLTVTLDAGGSDYTIDGVDEDATGVIFLATLSLANQAEPDLYEPALIEATIAGGVVTVITDVLGLGNGFQVGDVVDLVIDTTVAGQEDATGFGATATVTSLD
jgi:hypothetical protein